MVLTINGEAREVQAETVAALLEELAYDPSFLAVALNQAVVRRREWSETQLAAGDRVEILTPRQGG